METTRWERIKQIFHAVVDLPPAEQDDYLRGACGDDEALRSEILDMLAGENTGNSILDEQPSAVSGILEASPAPLTSLGPYRIDRLIGEGGMGMVYLATREDMGSFVAVKLLRGGLLSAERRQRFALEQKTLARMQHPLIAQIHDAGTRDDGTPWFVMEYVEGKPITVYLGERDATIEDRLKLFRRVCEAVQYAHSQAIIHRDLKPSNVLVRNDGAVKLLDFGIAKQLENEEQEQTLTEVRPMTIPYASPEQIRGEPLRTQTDVYSLGVMLYELLTCRLPFDFAGRRRTEAERIVLEQEPAAPSSISKLEASKSAWSDLDVLCLTAMHKDLQRRYASAEALIRDIDHYLKGEPLEARPDSLRYTLGKFVRRNRRVLSATAAISATFAALVVFFVVRLDRARMAALAETNRTQRIEQFMLNLFDGGDKTAGPADSLKAVTLVDRGARYARALSSEPGVQADLYATLGNIYQKLGKFDKAEPLLRSALERRRSGRMGNNGEMADSLIAMGLLKLDESHVEDAERLVRQALEVGERQSPANNREVARAEFALGRVLEERGKYNEAITVLERAAPLQEGRSDLELDLSDTMNAQVIAQTSIGHFDAADSLDRRLLAMDKRLYGADHPRVGDDLANLGVILYSLRRFVEAEQYYRQALTIKKDWYGKYHPDTAICMVGIAQAVTAQGKFDEAEVLLKEALAIQEQIYGEVHAQIAICLNMLGSLNLQRKRLEEAEAEFQRMADINRQVYGAQHPLVGDALENLGEVFQAKRDYPKAEGFYRQALQIFTDKLTPDHPYIAVTRLSLGTTLVAEKQYRQAEGQLLGAYALLLKQPKPSKAYLNDARTGLVTVYEALNEPERAAEFRAKQGEGIPNR